MSDALSTFNEGLQQAVLLDASSEGSERTLSQAFTEYMLSVLAEAGEVDDAECAQYDAGSARASAFEAREDDGTLQLFITDYRTDGGVQGLGKAGLEVHFKRLISFAEQASQGLWRRLEESSPAWDMAQRIDAAWPNTGELRLTLLTNSELRTNLPPETTVLGRSAHFSVWDIDRLQKLDSSGRRQEPLSVDLEEIWGEPVPCLGPHGELGSYQAYLLVIPGELLSRIYEIHGPHLLELNVRSFLQARGKVNRGIQESIREEPARFLAYNNGISMTASAVRIVRGPDGGTAIAHIDDLQIVNGGQTTASLHYAKVKTKADLSNVFVQAKLSVVVPEQLEELVPRISQFANSQNRVNMADFTANDPFHVELEKLSRTIWAPGASGTHQMTRWFYERARGQYADAHARERTPARQREFKRIHPLSQKFTKTDVAKFENIWDQKPWLVSLGAEKNFREFMVHLEGRSRFTPDEEYFENLVGKAILLRSTERLISRLQLGGYRAQAVAYTLAKLFNATAQQIDLSAIWRAQQLPTELEDCIQGLGTIIHRHLITSAGTRNVSEWAKREDCWKSVLALAWTVPVKVTSQLRMTGRRTRTRSETSVSEILTETERGAMDRVARVPAETWFLLAGWAKQTENLEPWQRSLAFSLGRNADSGKANSRKQAAQGAKILDEVARLGFKTG